MVKILSGDPGKLRDAFFRVGTEIKSGKIHVKLAKKRVGKDYKAVCGEFAEDSRKYNFDYNVIEYNNTGVFVVEELIEEYGLAVMPITTVNLGRDIKKKVNPKSMDKYEIVHWTISNLDKIIFPPNSKCSPDMIELKRQWQIFSEHRPAGVGTGNFQYAAPGSEHDDGVMALLINIHIGRNFLDGVKKDTVHITSRKAEYHDRDEDEFGTGAPEGATVHSRYVINN